MALTAVEVMALLLAVIGAIKIIVLLANPSGWKGVVKTIYGNRVATIVVSLILGAVTLYYLLNELTIVQIFAAMLFLMFLMVIGVASYGDKIIDLYDDLLKDRMTVKRAWLAILIWVALVIWVLYAIFI